MLDNNGLVLDKIRRMESRNVYKSSSILSINDRSEREGNKGKFKEKLNEAFATKRKFDTNNDTNNDANKDPNIIVDSSLTNRINEQKIISKLVDEKFVNNPKLKDKIEFLDNMTIEEKIMSLLEDVDDIEVKKTASELLLEQLELVIKKINDKG